MLVVNTFSFKVFPLRGYFRIPVGVTTYRTASWFDAVPARDALPDERKVVAKQPNEVI